MPKVGGSMAISLFADLHRFSPQSFVSFYYVSWTLNRVSTTDTDSPLLQPRLSKAAEDAVSKLLPAYAENDLGSMCSWADRVKFRYHWSSPLHYLNTPDNLCTLSKPNHFCPCYVVVMIIFARLLKLGRLYGLTKQRHGRPAAKHLFQRRYASEGIKAACDWAYKGVHEDSVLEGTSLLFILQYFVIKTSISSCNNSLLLQTTTFCPVSPSSIWG